MKKTKIKKFHVLSQHCDYCTIKYNNSNNNMNDQKSS